MTTPSAPGSLTQTELKDVVWRKSTRSANAGGQCVEVGAWHKSSRSASGGNANCVEAASWRKSTRSNNNGGSCVEVGPCSCHGIAVRDSKLPTTGDFPTLSMTRTDWTALLTTLRTS